MEEKPHHHHHYVVEHAKSDRSHCHGQCHGDIPQGHLRLGRKEETGFVSWRCFPQCITRVVASHINDVVHGKWQDIKGYNALSPAEQTKLRHAFDKWAREVEE